MKNNLKKEEKMNSILFEQASIKNIQLKNRFVRSATMEGMATPDGLPTGELKDLYCMLADGEVGFIITSGAIIEPYKHFPENFSTALAIDENDKIEAWGESLMPFMSGGQK